ncbi:MAG: glycosyltransferase family 39 protein [Patescibacteria group bacterium]
MKIRNWLLIGVLALAAFLRLWNLASVPPHLTADEAALGYNAYSILKTGRDEYGQSFPVIFKSFGDYKPGLYVYLTVPSVAVFGLNEFAVRFPSALAGVFVVYLVYLVSSLLFKEKRISLISAFVMAITPWGIYFSRGAWEVNLSLSLTLAGIYFFLKSLEKEKYLYLSALFFSLTLIAYQGAKLSTGIVLLILVFLYWKKLIRFEKRNLATALIVGLVISSPILLSLFKGQTGRLTVFSIFSYPRPREYTQAFLDEGGEKFNTLTYYLFHSETLNFKRGILGRWFNHFSGRFLFFEGDWPNPRHSAPYQGMLLLSDLALLIVGFLTLIRKGLNKETAFVWLWLILAPMPAALSRDAVHAVRAMNMVVPLVFFLAFGFNAIINQRRKILKYSFFGVYILAFIYFLDAYFVHVPKHNSKYWEYGYKQIVETVTGVQKNYKRVKIQQSFAQPYIYFLFHQKYDPAKYQKQASLKESEYKGDVGYVTKLGNIEFAPIDWSVVRGEHGTLFVADTIRIPPQDSKDESQFKLIKEIKYLDGNPAFRIIEVK